MFLSFFAFIAAGGATTIGMQRQVTIESDAPDWLIDATTTVFGERRVEIVQPYEERHIQIQQPRASSSACELRDMNASSTNHRWRSNGGVRKRSLGARQAFVAQKHGVGHGALDHLISSHAKGLSTLVNRRLHGQEGDLRGKLKRKEALVMTVRQLEETLGVSARPITQPWQTLQRFKKPQQRSTQRRRS